MVKKIKNKESSNESKSGDISSESEKEYTNLKSSKDDFLPQKKNYTFSSDTKPKKIIKSKTKKQNYESESDKRKYNYSKK